MSPVAVVLDASAVLAYADGRLAVGELIAMVGEEGRLVAVPVSCLVTARAVVADEFAVKQLGRLTRIESVAVLPLMSDEAMEVGQRARVTNGDVGAGHAVHVALTYEAYFATTEPKAAAQFLPTDWGILDLSA